MKIMDGHCDALTKLYMNPKLDFNQGRSELDVSLSKTSSMQVLRCNVLPFILSESIQSLAFDHILQMIDVFHRKIVSHPRHAIYSKS